MINLEKQRSSILVSFFITLLLHPIPIWGQASVAVHLSKTEIKANDPIELTFSLNEPEDFYYFSAEVLFDDAIFEFIDIETTGLTSNGLSVADLIEPGRLGVSVTLTQAMLTADMGAFMRLIFNVKSRASVGIGTFSFDSQYLGDSIGNAIVMNSIANPNYTVNESIGEAILTMNQTTIVTEGGEFNAEGKIYSSGITNDALNESRLRVWVGVHNQNTDPATWGEENWQLMDFMEKDVEDFFNYSGEISFMRPVGNWYVALRADLDADGAYKYGGIEGFWNNNNATLTIETAPPFRYTIAGWNFDNETKTTSGSVPDNVHAVLEIVGASLNGYSAGASGQAKNSRDWDGYLEGANYWQVVISTKNFENLRISSKQYGSGTGPRDFKLQTSVDGIIWNDVPGGGITVETNWTSGIVSDLTLPAELNNLEQVFIRWVQTSDFRISGIQGVSSAGTNRIDDILITGTNMNVQTVEVWPGDTNNDGVVDETDLLPIGHYWLSKGPVPIYNSKSWEPRTVEGWIPQAATFANASGSGRVDQNDLQPIGLNFGQNRNINKSRENQFDMIAQYEINSLEMGESMDLYLLSPDKVEISGISIRLQFVGIDSEAWSIDSVEPLEWGKEWAEHNRILRFETRKHNYHAAAMVHKGPVETVLSDRLLRITIRADETWPQTAIVELLRANISSGKKTYPLTDVYLTDNPDEEQEIFEPNKPSRTQLLVNYPNPFNPTTVIPFTLSEAGDVRVDIYDAIGRRVKSIIREGQQPGEYEINFDGSSLSSGVYIYQLQVNDVQQTRMMTLVK